MDSNPNKNHVLWMVLNIYDLWYMNINSIVVCVCVCHACIRVGVKIFDKIQQHDLKKI